MENWNGENMAIFDDVFVPWDRVFMCGENKYAILAAHLFAPFHRHNGCGGSVWRSFAGYGRNSDLEKLRFRKEGNCKIPG